MVATAAPAATALGGAIDNTSMGVLTINPELGAKKGSKQSKATNLFTGNLADSGAGGIGGGRGSATGGMGGMSGGQNGTSTPGSQGPSGLSGSGIGGGLNLESGGTAKILNTNVTGNRASTTDDDIDRTTLE